MSIVVSILCMEEFCSCWIHLKISFSSLLWFFFHFQFLTNGSHSTMYKDNPSGHCLLGCGPQPWMNSIDCLVGVLWPIEDSDLDLILHSLDWILFIYFFIFFMSNSVTWDSIRTGGVVDCSSFGTVNITLQQSIAMCVCIMCMN